MPRVTIVRPRPDDEPGRRKARIAVQLDGRAWLRAADDELAELGLADGDELDADAVEAIEIALARTRARLFVVRSLTARAQSVAEIEAKLAARQVPPTVAAEVVDQARGYGYLDDEALAAQLARGALARGHGRRRAEQSLRARRLPTDVADRALDAAFGDVAEVELALGALGRRTFGDGDQGRRKAVAFLARRGFSSAAAWAAVRRREAADATMEE